MVFVPQFIYIDFNDMDGDNMALYITGYLLDRDKGVFDESGSGPIGDEYTVPGLIFTVIIFILGLIYLLSVILPKYTNKDISHKEKLWIFTGILAFLIPQLLALTYISIESSSEGIIGFGTHINLFSFLVPLAGVCGIVAGVKNLQRENYFLFFYCNFHICNFLSFDIDARI